MTGSVYCEGRAEAKETVENPGSNPIDDKNKESKVCKSVHHRTIQINHQPDTTIF